MVRRPVIPVNSATMFRRGSKILVNPMTKMAYSSPTPMDLSINLCRGIYDAIRPEIQIYAISYRGPYLGPLPMPMSALLFCGDRVSLLSYAWLTYHGRVGRCSASCMLR